MNTWSDWFRALASELVEGAVDSFLIVSGGGTIAATAPVDLPHITVGQLGWSVLLGAAWYGAAWIKAHPLPSCVPTGTQRTEAQNADPSAGVARSEQAPAADLPDRSGSVSSQPPPPATPRP